MLNREQSRKKKPHMNVVSVEAAAYKRQILKHFSNLLLAMYEGKYAREWQKYVIRKHDIRIMIVILDVR